jgi:hypothetical protein
MLRDSEGISHRVRVQATTLFEAAAAAVATFRQERWAADALTPAAILHVEVQVPPIIHDVSLRAVEKWLGEASASPKEAVSKERFRRERPRIGVSPFQWFTIFRPCNERARTSDDHVDASRPSQGAVRSPR